MTEPTKAISKPAIRSILRTRAWWAAAADGRLLLQYCNACGHVQHYPRVICARCWSEDLNWRQALGIGTVVTLTVAYVPGHPAWTSEVPYVLALVELDEGPRLMTNIVSAPVDEIPIGARVRQAIANEVTTPGLIQFVLDNA